MDNLPPSKAKRTNDLDFYQALRKISKGATITKREWTDEKVFYCFLLDGILMIHNESGDHTWVISESDMNGQDYQVIEK